TRSPPSPPGSRTHGAGLHVMNEKPSASEEELSSGADVRLPSQTNGVSRMSQPSRSGGKVVLAVRLGLLLGTVVALAGALHLARDHDRQAGSAEALSTERYACPMHPEV